MAGHDRGLDQQPEEGTLTVLDWPGCANVRDLGGLPTSWGGRIRTGALVRADRPGRETVRTLFGYGVGLVLDLRLAPTECTVDPSPLAGHPAYRNISVLRDEDTVLEEMGDGLPAIYRAILDRGGANLARALAAIAWAPPGGVLVHCHSGKDRTGLVVALALELAGVSQEEIARDYARTPGVTADTMLRTLTYLRDGYGGAQPYLMQAGFGRADVTRLRVRLTRPAG